LLDVVAAFGGLFLMGGDGAITSKMVPAFSAGKLV
jgi:hypothetical protein